MIQKILIANRGEIALRIMRACRPLSIKTVAVYSEADQEADFVNYADESYLIGTPPVNQSYLDTDKIIEVAKKAGVDAIHPGYGFLSESKLFANLCEANDIIFIGPSADLIEQMGDKVSSRKLMEEAGVPIIPGSKDVILTAEDAIIEAKAIGYPVMLKASAGGGGIGMQIVSDPDNLKEAFINNSKRAEQFFGDGSMFMEKLLVNSRHIEVQLLGDHHGNVIHLYERECSIQRRNQKVIEEAPSTFISEKTRELMGKTAVKAAKSIGYTNAGTIEFLVDENENFYFLEMNTRVQVEHGITEEVTHIDIVKEQIKIANNQKLSISQSEVNLSGHAIEGRIYAEDPVTSFPSPGQVTHYREPVGKHIRVESAISGPSAITHFYDPMISKLIVKGSDRNEAIKLFQDALESYELKGIKTNIPMLKAIAQSEEFINGKTTTDFIEKNKTKLHEIIQEEL